MAIIEVKNISKKYVLGEQQRYLALRDTLASFFKKFSISQKSAHKENEFWALKDVSFSVERGEILGIIGRNGAGKSTLLKILSQITPPTTGEIKLRGRVGSLLEVGTGFHPELSGRENIYLNGAILGMSHREIVKKFDEIVEFAGVEKFLDTPVKRYSSGMYVRLAFAVAAHLEPEILIVDEVLAVGDAEFQKKCLGKMEEVTKKDGRTVLFVSHNMGAIKNLCPRAILLDQGEVKKIGSTGDVIGEYLQLNIRKSTIDIASRQDRKGNGKIKIMSIEFVDAGGEPVAFFRAGEDAYIRCVYESRDSDIETFNFGFSIDTFFDQTRIAFVGNKITQQKLSVAPGVFTFKIKKLPLNVGRYQFSIICADNGKEIYDWVQKAGEFEVEYGDFYTSRQLPPADGGVLLLDYHFEQ